MIDEFELALDDGRLLRAYDTGPPDARLTVAWHHGTPNVGRPPEPLFATSGRLGIRWIGYDRPGYGTSTRHPGRDVASAAADAAAVAEALGVERFGVMGHSGGGPHALACAALLPERVTAVVAAASLAPFGAAGLEWFTGMAPSGEASLRAALAGRETKERHEASAPEGDPGFVEADLVSLRGDWSWFGRIVEAGLANGPDGLVDDDLAYVSPWGFDPGDVEAPTLLLHGASDRVVPASHSRWLAARIVKAEHWLRPKDGHISILREAPAALEWLVERAG
jgi:pimeloyl-ACP methyl ester carboxylesterase